jgi:hypothetical protein
MIGVK